MTKFLKLVTEFVVFFELVPKTNLLLSTKQCFVSLSKDIRPIYITSKKTNLTLAAMDWSIQMFCDCEKQKSLATVDICDSFLWFRECICQFL